MDPVVHNERVKERVIQPAVAGAPVNSRSNRFPAIAWSAIIGGLVVGLATHMVLMLLGVAAGLTAVEFTSGGAGGVQNAPTWSAVWNGISMLMAAFVGGYVAARMSGLRRKSDGMLHGVVAWGATTLLYAVLSASAMGAIFGSAFSTVTSAFPRLGTQQEIGQLQDRLQSMLGETTNINTQAITTENLNQLQNQIEAGDRPGAINFMVQTLGVERESATTVVDSLLIASGSLEQASPEAVQTVDQSVDVATTATWSLFIAVALSLLVAIGGGLLGAKGARRAPQMRAA